MHLFELYESLIGHIKTLDGVLMLVTGRAGDATRPVRQWG
jgi:hypothetical protein